MAEGKRKGEEESGKAGGEVGKEGRTTVGLHSYPGPHHMPFEPPLAPQHVRQQQPVGSPGRSIEPTNRTHHSSHGVALHKALPDREESEGKVGRGDFSVETEPKGFGAGVGGEVAEGGEDFDHAGFRKGVRVGLRARGGRRCKMNMMRSATK